MPKHSAQAAKNDLDALLFDILSSIAAILVSTGYGFPRVNELAKMAFVRAAHSVDLDFGPRLSKARIAALTGLTRTDVSKIIRLLDGKQPLLERPTNRVARVASGWMIDTKFSQPNSKPRPLKFTGYGNTFSALVRQYSGDIPPKAMLKEMTRLGMVRQDYRGKLMLVRGYLAQSRRTTSALRAAIPWVSFLAGASTSKIESELTSRSDRFELKFSSLPQVFAAMRELHGRHRAFVTALEQLGGRTASRGRFALNVSVAVAATNPRVSNSRSQSGSKSKGVKVVK